MTHEQVAEANLLLRYLIEEREEVLAALRQHPLSQAVATESFPSGELGVAYALYLIVQDNPDLQEFVSEEIPVIRSWQDWVSLERKERRIDDIEEYHKSQEESVSHVKPIQTSNTVNDICTDLMAVLEQEYVPPQNDNDKPSLIQKLFGRYLS